MPLRAPEGVVTNGNGRRKDEGGRRKAWRTKWLLVARKTAISWFVGECSQVRLALGPHRSSRKGNNSG
jgi:hypothetical protein